MPAKSGSSGSKGKVGNSRLSQCKYWAGTLNNPTEEQQELLLQKCLGPGIQGFVFQSEIGGDGEDNAGTPHLQIHIEFEKKARPTQFFGIKEIHWSTCRNVAASRAYCQKEDTRTAGPWYGGTVRRMRPLTVLEPARFHPWQAKMDAELGDEPNDRKIVWLWEQEGSVGKSAFAKYLVVKRDAIVLSGKTADVFYGVQQYIEKHSMGPEIVVLDVPRSMLDYINYQSIEKIKDGMFFSGKYEGGMCIFNAPHIVVMSNAEPDLDKMSADRWDVREIVNKDM